MDAPADGSQAPPPGGESPAITVVGQPIGSRIEKTIGAAGGTIATTDGKVNLVIPAGALDNDQLISIQRIENNAPLGISTFGFRFLPHGLHFKKDIQLALAYDESDMIGTSPRLAHLATQAADGSWKSTGSVSVNEASKIITASLNHFSDYSIYTDYFLRTDKTSNDNATVHVNTSQEVSFTVVNTVDRGNGLLPALVAGSEVKNWSVNGIDNPSPLLNIGWFGSSGPGSNFLSQRNYVAPFRAPSPATVTVTTKLDLGSLGQLFLLRNVTVDDVNRFNLNGINYDQAVPSAIILEPGNLLSLGMLQTIGNKSASVGISIQNLNTAPGTYHFTGSPEVLITAHDQFGNRWASEKFDPVAGKVYTGSIELTISGSAPNRYVTGTITGTLFGSDGTVNSAPIDAVFGVKGF